VVDSVNSSKRKQEFLQKQHLPEDLFSVRPQLVAVRDGITGMSLVRDPIFNTLSRPLTAFKNWLEFAEPYQDIPPQHHAALRELEINAEIDRHRNAFIDGSMRAQHVNLMRDLRADLERDLPGMNDRKNAEIKLANYIRDKIVPGGLIETPRGYVDAWKMSEKHRHCRSHGQHGINTKTGKKASIFMDKCGMSKTCPFEARAEAERLKEKYIPVFMLFLLLLKEHSFQSWVLTVPNCSPEDLSFVKQDIFSRFAKLNRRKCMDNVVGAMAIEEDPLAESGDFNVHLNVIVLTTGWVDWKEVRAAWGYNIHFDSAEECHAKTVEKLKKQGRDISNLPVEAVLIHAFMEICKYATRTVPDKSAAKLGLTKAPPMTEWTDAQFRAWFAANYGFRRTRTYGILNDAPGFMWQAANQIKRAGWLVQAELPVALEPCAWRKGDDALSAEERKVLRDPILGIVRTSLKDVLWFTRSVFVPGRGYVLDLISLIQGDKLAFQGPGNCPLVDNLATGPPVDGVSWGGLRKNSGRTINWPFLKNKI